MLCGPGIGHMSRMLGVEVDPDRGERLQDALLGICEQAWDADGDGDDADSLIAALNDLWEM